MSESTGKYQVSIEPSEQIAEIEGLVPVYQEAFRSLPWYEVSQCPAPEDFAGKCVGGFSKLPVGSFCNWCMDCPSKAAYPTVELSKKFTELFLGEETALYTEKSQNDELLLAGLAWRASPIEIAVAKYSDVPAMLDWLEVNLPQKMVWLDEVFADLSKRESGNLWNFRLMCEQLGKVLKTSVMAYRSINPPMLVKPAQVFGVQAKIFSANKEVPDRRDFVVIDLEGADNE